jgi:peptide deformylase
MMQLITFPNPVLKQKAEHWNFETDTGADSLEVDMVQLMVESKGIGLAANQVGLLKRVFAIYLKDQVPFCMFNPYILHGDNDMVHEDEGCLSFPDLFFKVPRHKNITAGYVDRQGNKRIIELSGIDARCFQHELDHLDGVCYTEYISPLKLALAIKKQRKKRNGRTK